MTERLFDDLGAWEAGELPLAELERRHGAEPVRGITGLHEALSAVASAPVPDPAIGWTAVRERMDVRRGSSRGRARRVVVGALVAAVLSASAAFAAPGAFHAVVERIGHGVHAVFGGNEGKSHAPAPLTRPTHGHDHRVGTGPNPNDPTPGSTGDTTGGSTHAGGSGEQGSGGDQGDGTQGSGSGGSDQQGSGDGGDQGGGGGSDQSGGGSGSGGQGSGSGGQGNGD
jgi:hypothetical protein